MLEVLDKLVGKDLVQIFGETGSGKTTFALKVVEKYVSLNKKILYIDTEKNLLKQPEGCDYKYYAEFDEMAEYLKNLPKGYDLIILDSLGLPILGKYAWLNAREKGDILAKCSAISYSLKVYCQQNNAMGIVLNQPESEFAKSPYHILRCFGDKARFFYKELWKSKIVKQEPNLTICKVEAFRSRRFGRKTLLFEVTITSAGIKIENKIGVVVNEKESAKH